jgi:CRP-like cAMP-binding protein
VPKKPAPSGPTAVSRSRNVRTDGDGNPLRNKILLGLPRKERDAVFSKLNPVKFELHHLLQEVGRQIDYCYFPNTMMASVLNIMADGKSVEVGLAGWEGFVGLPSIAGFRTSASRVVVQAEGTAFRISAGDMRRVVRSCPQLAIAMLRYSQEATMEVTQIAACNRLHEVDRRLARWLLMSQDRIRLDVLPLTQEFLAQMLGTRRASVSVAANILERAGLIQSGRGCVSILTRKGLEDACCECYGVIRQQLENWRRESQYVALPYRRSG